MSTKKNKLIVILSGGGAKAAFQAGAWQWIKQQGILLSGTIFVPDVPNGVFGVSGGGLNGVMIASGKHQQLFDLWNEIAGNPSEIYTSDFISQENEKIIFNSEKITKYLLSELSLLQKAGLLFKRSRKKVISKIFDRLRNMKSLASSEPLMSKLNDLVSIEGIKSEVFQAGFVSLTDGNYYAPSHFEYNSDADFQKGVMASADIPVLWSPIDRISLSNFELTHLVDGGVRNATPFGDAVDYINQSEDADYHFLVISCHTGRVDKMEGEPNVLNVAKRSLADLISTEVQQNDLSTFLQVNKLVKQAESKGIELKNSKGQKLKAFKVKTIQPNRELGFALDFSRTSVLDSFAHGFQRASKILRIPEWD